MAMSPAGSSESKPPPVVYPHQNKVVRERLRNGQCPNCGQQCYRLKGVLRKRKPISCEGLVENGRCLKCNPLHLPDGDFNVLHQVVEDENSLTTGTMNDQSTLLDSSAQEHRRHPPQSDDANVMMLLNHMERCRQDIENLKEDNEAREHAANELSDLVCQLSERLSHRDAASQQLIGQADNLDLELCAVKLALNQTQARNESSKQAMDNLSRVVIELKDAQKEMLEEQEKMKKKQEIWNQDMEKKMEKQEEDIKNLRDEVNSLTCRAVEDILSCVGSILHVKDSPPNDESPDDDPTDDDQKSNDAMAYIKTQHQQDHDTLRNSEIHFVHGTDGSFPGMDESSISMSSQFVPTKGDDSIAASSKMSSSHQTNGTHNASEGSLWWDPDESCRINPDHMMRDHSGAGTRASSMGSFTSMLDDAAISKNDRSEEADLTATPTATNNNRTIGRIDENDDQTGWSGDAVSVTSNRRSSLGSNGSFLPPATRKGSIGSNITNSSIEVVQPGRRGSNESDYHRTGLNYSITSIGPTVTGADQDPIFVEEGSQDIMENDFEADDEADDENTEAEAEAEMGVEVELEEEEEGDNDDDDDEEADNEAEAEPKTAEEPKVETKTEVVAEAKTTTLPVEGLTSDAKKGTVVNAASEGDAATDVTGVTQIQDESTTPEIETTASEVKAAVPEKQDELATDTADDNNAKTMAKNVRFKDQQRMECNLVIAKLSTATGKEEVRRSLEEVGDIARDPDSRKAIGRKINGISLVLQLMNRFKDHSDILEMGCRALSNLACGNLVNQESIARKNGIVIVLQAMRRFGDNAAIQQRACYALGNLALNNPPNQEQLVEKNGVVIILQAMQKFPHDAQVQHRACFALGKVVRNGPSFQQRVRSYGGPDLIKAALDNHPHNTRVQKLGKSLLTVLKPRERRMSMTTKTMRELYHIRD